MRGKPVERRASTWSRQGDLVRRRASSRARRTEPSPSARAPRRQVAGRLASRADRGSATAALTSASASGRSSRRRQRERMVGRSRCGAWLTIRKSERGGGSSITFSRALALAVVEVLGAVDDADPVAAVARRSSRTCARAWRTASTGIVVGVASCRSVPASGAARAGSDATGPRPAARRGNRATASVEVAQAVASRSRGSAGADARHPVGEGRLADALRAADEPGVVEAARFDQAFDEGASRVAMAEERELLARMRGVRADVSGGDLGIGVTTALRRSLSRRRRAAGSARSRLCQIASATASAGRGRIDDDAALGLASRRSRGTPRAASAWKASDLRLEAVGASPASRACAAAAREPDLGRQVEDQGQVGPGPADDTRSRLDQRPVEAARARPDRPGSNRRSGRTAPMRPAPGPAGWSRRDGRSARRRTAAPRRTGRRAWPRRRGEGRGCASARGEPPGSRVTRTGCPAPRGAPRRRAICVDLPAPSPPSNVMKTSRRITSPYRATLVEGAPHPAGADLEQCRPARRLPKAAGRQRPRRRRAACRAPVTSPRMIWSRADRAPFSTGASSGPA